MEPTTARQIDREAGGSGYRCVVCGVWRKWEEQCCCDTHAYAGLDPVQYVELFWDEA